MADMPLRCAHGEGLEEVTTGWLGPPATIQTWTIQTWIVAEVIQGVTGTPPRCTEKADGIIVETSSEKDKQVQRFWITYLDN